MKRPLRLLIFALAALLVILVVLDVGLAWVAVSAMTHPFCQTPQTIEGMAAPEEHWLDTEDGISIRVWYYPSQNGAAILALGGMSGSLGNRLPPMEHLIRAGYGVIQIDSRACAQPRVPVTQGHDELYDAQAALDFLFNRPEIDPQRIGAAGFSMGGATALRAAARLPEIRAVVRDGGFADLGRLLSPQGSDSLAAYVQKATILLLYRLRSGINPTEVDCIADLASINPRPVLLIYGEREAAAGQEQAEASGENVTLWMVPNGAHGSNHLAAPDEYVRRTLAFFEQALLK